MLAAVLATQDRQSLAHRRAHHEGVSRAQAVLVRLRERELLEVQTQLAHVGLLLNRDLTRVRPVLASRVGWVDEDRLILVRDATTGELEGTTGAEAVGTRTDRGTRASRALGVRETGARVTVVAVACRILEANDVQDPCSGSEVQGSHRVPCYVDDVGQIERRERQVRREQVWRLTVGQTPDREDRESSFEGR